MLGALEQRRRPRGRWACRPRSSGSRTSTPSPRCCPPNVSIERPHGRVRDADGRAAPAPTRPAAGAERRADPVHRPLADRSGHVRLDRRAELRPRLRRRVGLVGRGVGGRVRASTTPSQRRSRSPTRRTRTGSTPPKGRADMAGAKKSTWVGGTVFVGLVIAAAAWFLAISPTLAAAAELRPGRATREQNELLEMKVTQAQGRLREAAGVQGRARGLSCRSRRSAMLSDYLRQLDPIAVAHRSRSRRSRRPSRRRSSLAVPAVAAPAPADAATAESARRSDGRGRRPRPRPRAGAGVPGRLHRDPVRAHRASARTTTRSRSSDLQNATPRSSSSRASPARRRTTGAGEREAGDGGRRPGARHHAASPTSCRTRSVSGAGRPERRPPALPGAVPGKNPLVPIAGR